MSGIGYLIILAVIAAAAGILLVYRHHTKRTLQTLNQMLDYAINGEFITEHFDESMLSSLEVRFSHYLDASTVSARNLQAEKNSIKSLIADISHQTKTPLANVLLYTQLLGEQKMNPDCRIYIGELEAQTKKLQTLIDALVKTSRLETGMIAFQPARNKLEEVIHSAVSQLLPKASEKQISITVESVGTDALFDPKWTEEAIVNLLDNAVKYTPANGHVTVNVTEYQLFSCINITDTGYGIGEEEHPKIFKRFYRGMEHQTTEGVGIGLYLVRQIAEGQGGYVQVRSSRGKGAVFSLYIPRD